MQPNNPVAEHPHDDLDVEELTTNVEEAIDRIAEQKMQKIQEAVNEANQ